MQEVKYGKKEMEIEKEEKRKEEMEVLGEGDDEGIREHRIKKE